jgi:AcrR family transcriptional regulator
MGVTERRQREKEAVRNQILTAAMDLFVEEGFENLSMRKIAERIEYAPSTIYLYFQDKEELFSTIVLEVFQELTERISALQALHLPPLQSLERGMRIYIEFGLRHPHHYRLTFGPCPVGQDRGRVQPCDTAGQECFDTLRVALQRCIDSGDIEVKNLEVLAQSVWTMIHGVTDLLIVSKTVPNFPWVADEELISTSIETIIRGISYKGR